MDLSPCLEVTGPDSKHFGLDNVARLLITCPDRPGVVAAVCGFLFSHGANITALDQHSSDPEGGTLFMRLEFQTPYLDISKAALEQAFKKMVADNFNMTWRMIYAGQLKRAAIMVSKTDHCLLELLWRWSRGELPCEITCVISNHPDLEGAVRPFGMPFHHVPFSSSSREQAEDKIFEILGDRTDVVILARYMQILSERFVGAFENKLLNIHHSFLPAFIGADPYRQAYERGVKLIGATAHYVTLELDSGPIIDQDVLRVSHRDNPATLKMLGQDIERRVLARAVKWHLDDCIIVHENKTIVFE